jgi:serpin B
MFLINALYFKGDWVIKFDEAETQKQDFFIPEEPTVDVDMMTTSDTFSYYAGENFQAARLPYGRDKIAMYIFLPDENIPLYSFIANLNQTTHDDYISRLSPVDDLTVKLPKFKVEYGVKRLNSILETLGMEIAFNPLAANLSGIATPTSGNLYISYVDHKATIEVNEKGTEAAAATSVGIGLTSMPPSFIVNRPFFFEIRDDRSGSILFMGTIVNPTQT